MEGAPPPKLITLFKLSTDFTQFTMLALFSMLTVAPLFSLFILHPPLTWLRLLTLLSLLSLNCIHCLHWLHCFHCFTTVYTMAYMPTYIATCLELIWLYGFWSKMLDGVEWSTWYGDKSTSLKTCRLLKLSCFYLRQEQEFSRLVQTNLEVCLWHPETIKERLSEVEKGVTGTDFWKGFKLMNVYERLDQPWQRVIPLFITHICIFIYKGFKLTSTRG